MKLSLILGTRPEAIKLAPVITALRKHPFLRGHICVTGQHREMLDQVLDSFDLTPDTDLALMTPGQSLGGLCSRLMSSLDAYLEREKPDMVMVQGDTATAFAGALAAYYRKIPSAHVEAGLRTFDLMSPWPEEGNRALIGRLASLHFAPTSDNKANLLREGISADKIFVTGNTVIDAMLMAAKKVDRDPPEIPGLSPELMANPDARMILVTSHRRENLGDGLKQICLAIRKLATLFPKLHFVFPVHLNPKVQKLVYRSLRGHNALPNVHLLAPLSYLPFVRLMKRSSLILTDSGGIQEEAPSLDKPVLVMRTSTERIEAVDAGTVRVVGTCANAIVAHAADLLFDQAAYDTMANAENPYGDGHATERILEHCAGYLRSVMTSGEQYTPSNASISLDAIPNFSSLSA